jgi:hypothetical protein
MQLPEPEFRRAVDVNELAIADDDVSPATTWWSMAEGFPACGPLESALEDMNLPLTYNATYREIGIAYPNEFSKVILAVCPFCGVPFPSSMRLAWFDELDRLGLEAEDPAVPDELRDDSWWREPRPGLVVPD